MMLGIVPRSPEPGKYFAITAGGYRRGQDMVEIEVKPWYENPAIMAVTGWCVWPDAHHVFVGWGTVRPAPSLPDNPTTRAFRVHCKRRLRRARHDERARAGMAPWPYPERDLL